MRQVKLLLFFTFLSSVATSQNFGGNPPTKWAQINTDTVKVIFPTGLDSIAQRIATLAHHLQRDSIYKHRYKKISIVLQNNATISNAYVSLAPYRSEFYLTPPQNAFELGSLSWADNLIVHEWRHVQQYNYFNRGLASVAGAILGEEGRALFNAIAVPDWFFEGDAVLGETKYTKQGRGRLPLAFSSYKSLLLANKDYSYMKLRNGSLKDLVPNHYDLGYLLVAYGVEKYGDDFWTKVTADAAAFKPLIYPLQGAVKKHAGISYKQFVNDAFSYYQDQWKKENKGSDLNWLTKENNYRTDYLFPYADEKGKTIALKQSSKSNPAFISLSSDGKEDIIAAQDITLDRYFSYRNGRIVYAAYNPDARWSNREYSNIVLLDINTGSRKKLTTKSKYFSPDISSDGKYVVAVNLATTGEQGLVLMDEAAKITRIINPGNGEVFSYPKFSKHDDAVFVIARNSKGLMSLQKFSLIKQNNVREIIIPFGNYVIGFPVVNGDTVTFTATTNGSDDVYAWVETNNKMYHIASYPSGLYQSTLENGKLIASAFTASGQRLAVINMNWKEVAAPPTVNNLYVDQALDASLNITNIPSERFSYRKYSTLSHPFNFHSWRPYYDPPEYSFTVYGQNVLNTIATELAYTYNENENSHSASGNLIYGGTFIQPFVGLNHTWNRSLAVRPDTVAYWNEMEWFAGLQLPLELTGGKMYRYLNLSASYHSSDINFTGSNKNLFKATDVRYVQGRIIFTSQLQKAAQHIFPKFAFTGLVQMRTSTNVHARQFLASGNVYLPGLFKTHSIVVSAAYQGRDTMRRYGFTNNFAFSRGYDGGVDFPRMWKIGGNYHFPLIHPDWGFANLVYFQRIRANAFIDLTQVKSLRTGAVSSYISSGGEVYFDTKWWNQLPVTFGIRYNRLMNGGRLGLAPNQWEIILPVDLIR